MDSLSMRMLRDDDYAEILVGWWNQWGWEAPPQDFLPQNGEGGIIISDGIIPICAGFVYLTNSKVAWVDWIISNKKYTDRIKRKEALLALIDRLTIMAKDLGAKYCYALIKNENLINVYKDCGYINGDTYTSEMIKHL
jgi:hypothetical protein